MRAIRRDEATAIDRLATERFGIPSALLMECAGLATARVALAEAIARKSLEIVILAGPGNNGGDGVVAARHAANRGALPVSVVLCASDAQLSRQSAESRLQLEIARRMGIGIDQVAPDARIDSSREGRLSRANVLFVDALFGIGQRGAVAGAAGELIRAINGSKAPIVSVDVPSGLDCETGEPLGIAVRAAITLTFGLPKTGLLVPSARPYVGRLGVAEIGFPKELLGLAPGEAQPDVVWLETAT